MGAEAEMKPIRIALRVVAVSLALSSGAVGPSQAAQVPAPAPDKLEAITAFFTNEVATGKLPGAVILVQQHGRPVYLKSFGVQDVRTGTPMSPDTIFAIHSMVDLEGRLRMTTPGRIRIYAGQLASRDCGRYSRFAVLEALIIASST